MIVSYGGLTFPEFQRLDLYIEQFGEFEFVEFESQEQLFAYVSSEGYGWDEDKPGICYAFEWHEDPDNKDYELEVYFPAVYDARIIGAYPTNSPPAPLASTSEQIWTMFKTYNGGIQNLINIGANQILRKMTGNQDASIT